MSFQERINKSKRIICRRWRLLVWLTLILIFAAPLEAERLPIKTYTVADGLLRDNVFKIRQDSRGFLWFCTAEGISRFDGYAFTNFTIADGLPDRYVNDFLETKNGAIYIATKNGLARLNPIGARARFDRDRAIENPNFKNQNSLFSVYLPDNERAREISVLFEDESGTVWAGTSDGLYKLINADGDSQLERVNLGVSPENDSDGFFVNAMIKDRRGALWIGTRASGLFRLAENGETRRFTIADGLPLTDIVSLYQTTDGALWTGFRDILDSVGLCLLDAETSGGALVKKCYSLKDGLSSSWIADINQTSDGQIWLATTNGLCRWQGDGQKSVCQTYTAKNDLCDKDIWSILEDKDGNLWTGSRCGAKKIARYGFTNYTAADGLSSPSVNSIFENQSGDLFASVNLGSTRVVSRFDGEKFLTIKPHLPPEVTYAGWGLGQTIWQDHLGAWWIPTGNGLFRSPDQTNFDRLAQTAFQRVAYRAKTGEIFRLFEDSRGDIWMATTGGAETGLFRWERAADVWHDYTRELGFSANRLGSVFAEDRDGTVWIGTGETDSVLIRYRDGQFKVFGRADDFPAGWIRDLFFDRAGNLWIANIEVGLLKVADPRAEKLSFARYSTAEGLSSVGVCCITEDNFGRIYAGTGRGLDRLNPSTGQIENFTSFDGLLGSFVENCYRDTKGFLWFGTSNGLARFQPEPEKQRRPPTIFITGVRVGGEPQNVSILGEREIPEIELDAEQRQVSVDFLGLGANLGEHLTYEYRLSGGDWTPTIERTVNFANLSSGSYRFEIRAETADRIASQTPAVLSFRIAAPLWQKWWFVAAVFLAVAVFIYLLYRYRVARLLEVADMRARIATDLHDDIGTNLSKISLLSEIVNLQLANQNVESSRLLNSIAEISRESVSSMSDIVWAINPKRDSALDLARRMRLHLEESFLDKNVRVRFNAPDADGASIKLSMDARRELYLIFKEAVSNAARHADCRNVEVDFRLENDSIFLRIADDGRGFDASEKTDGNGLENMRSRAVKNGGNFEIESEAERGTILKIRVPQN